MPLIAWGSTAPHNYHLHLLNTQTVFFRHIPQIAVLLLNWFEKKANFVVTWFRGNSRSACTGIQVSEGF